MRRVLVIEADRGLHLMIREALEQEGWHVVSAYSLREGDLRLSALIDLVLLDVHVTDGNAYVWRERLRERLDLPVLFLTSCELAVNEATGEPLAGDDYLMKPLAFNVLCARARAVLRTSRHEEGIVWGGGPFRFSFSTMRYYKYGRPLRLSLNEQKLLKSLVCAEGKSVSYDTLLQDVWGDQSAHVGRSALTATMKRLRMKIEDVPSHPEYLQTVYGIGYRWNGYGS